MKKNVWLILLCFSLDLQSSLSVEKNKILEELRIPFDVRVKRLKQFEFQIQEAFFHNLIEVIEAKEFSLEAKWNALMTLGEVYKIRSIPYLKDKLASPFWFIRNGALLALEKADKKEGRLAALKLLDDKSLVIRTSCVNILTRVGKSQDTQILIESFYSKQNIFKNQSLWIRHNIVNALAQIGGIKMKGFFFQALKNDDKRIQRAAVQSLERIDPQTAGQFSNLNWERRKQAWISFGKNQERNIQ